MSGPQKPTDSGQRPAVSRREFLHLLAGGTMGMALPALRARADAGSRPPNVILILTDDLGYDDLGCYWTPNPAPGYEKIETPHLDAMAEQGLRFTDFYASAAVCTPTRAALMSGCYSYRVGLNLHVLTEKAGKGLHPAELTIAELLKRRGYATGCIGKWHLGHQPQFLPTNQGFDFFYGLPYSNDSSLVQLMCQHEIVMDQADLPQNLLSQMYAEQALDFIDRNRARPFFLYLAHNMPHVPLTVSNKFRDSSARGLYGDVVRELDWNVGRILQRLQQLGLDNDTLVVFTSDNGPWLREGDNGGKAYPLRWGKSTIWEGGHRVPCIVRWPGHVPGGRTTGEIATMMDFYPTVAALAGAALPADRVIDGKDIRPLLAGEPGAASPYEAYFYIDNNQVAAVRKGRWKFRMPWLMEYTDVLTPEQMAEHKAAGGKTQEILPEALYDLETDIGEATNLLAQYPAKANELRSVINQFAADIERTKRPAGEV
ncbi:MAG: sulfatase [Kiritimatiellae bacterium]|nr:sulfatase [Kiritimatiellia bacterium]